MVAGADPGMTIRSLVDTRVSLGRRFRLLLIGLALAFRVLTQHFFSQSFPPPIRSYTCALALRIHHNRLGSMEVIAIPLVCCLSDLSASRAHAVVCSVSWS